MPILNVTLSTAPDAALSAKVAATLSQLTASLLGKNPAVTAVAISHVELTNGAVTLTADGWPLRRKKVLGTPAPQSGFPHLDWSTNQSAVQLGSWKSREEE